MAQDRSFHDYVLKDAFREVRGVYSRPMFGGWGLYRNGVIFAILVEGELYFKAGEGNRADFERKGSRPFTYRRSGRKAVAMSYWRLPQDVLEDPGELTQWIDRSVEQSLRSGKKRAPPKKEKKRG